MAKALDASGPVADFYGLIIGDHIKLSLIADTAPVAEQMDPSRRDDVRSEFIESLKEFHPVDAVVLHQLNTMRKSGWKSAKQLAEITMLRHGSVVVAFQNLEGHSCARKGQGNHFAITEFGEEQLLACQP